MKWTCARRNRVFYEIASAAGPGIPTWSSVRCAVGWRMSAWPSLYIRSHDDLAEIATELPWIDVGGPETVDPAEALEAIGMKFDFAAPHGADSSLWQLRVADRLVLSVRARVSDFAVHTAVATLVRTGFARKFMAYRNRMWQERGLPGFLKNVYADPKGSAIVSVRAEGHAAGIRNQIDSLRAALPIVEAAAARWRDAALAAESEVRLRASVD